MSESDSSVDKAFDSTTASGYQRTMTWRDGFSMALIVPVAIFATIGPSIATIGSLAVAAIFAVVCLFALFQNLLHAETASMFPDKPGGISLYAHEACKRYFEPLGAMTAFAYWSGWSLANAVFALTAATLLQAEFFPDVTWSLSTGTSEIGVSHLIAIALLVGIYLLNTTGAKAAALVNKVIGVLAVALLLLLGVAPFLTGDFHASNLTWAIGGDGKNWSSWKLAIAFFFIFGWSAYGTEGVVTFGPEYKDRKRDLRKALFTATVFTLVVAILMPLGLGGTVGDAVIAKDPSAVYATAFAQILGRASAVVTVAIVLCLCLVMNSGTATAGRALYGLAADDLTIRQLDHLNRSNVPSRAMLAGLLLNIGTLLFMGNTLAIIFTANIGYIFATVVAIAAFLLLRKDRPDQPRPFRNKTVMVPIAVVLLLVNMFALVIGFLYPEVSGSGGSTEQVVGVAVILSSLLLYAYRRVVQDGRPLQWRVREAVPSAPVQARSSSSSPDQPEAEQAGA